MSTRLGAIEALAGPLRPNLEALVRNLDRDTARSKRLIRQFLEEDREAFLRSAVAVLQEDRSSAGAQHLMSAIVAAGLLVPALCDSRLSREEAVALAQMAGRFDSNLEATLARRMAETGGATGNGESEDQVRLMEILAAISDGARIFPALVRLLRHPNAHVRSKAVLTIGRGNRSAAWVRQRLSDADPRIRANAAEALWGVESDDAQELLESLVRDSNNRVAGNAMVGLYRLGDQTAIPQILAMARRESALFRATAAWVMGATGDPRFTEALAELLREPHGVVRKRAFAALGSIRAAVAQARQAPEWRVFARVLDTDAARGRRIAFGLARQGAVPPALKATQVLLNEDGRSVSQYRVAERPLPETMSYVFLLPRSGRDAVRACLPWKRATDLWAVICYGPEPSQRGRIEGAPRFYSSADAIEAELARIPAAAECGDLWHNLRRAVALDSGGIPGRRQVIVINEAPQSARPSEELVAGTAAQAFVQAISSGPDAVVAEFCRRVNGVYRERDPDGVLDACLQPLARYEAAYHPAEAQTELLKLRLHGPGLWGETQVRLRG